MGGRGITEDKIKEWEGVREATKELETETSKTVKTQKSNPYVKSQTTGVVR